MYKILTFGPAKFFLAHLDPNFFFFSFPQHNSWPCNELKFSSHNTTKF